VAAEEYGSDIQIENSEFRKDDSQLPLGVARLQRLLE
jgi:hypothetical protein